MGARNLRLVDETVPASIELDAPEEGLEQALQGIAADLSELGTVRRDVRKSVVLGAALSALFTVGVIGALLVALRPAPPPPAIIIQQPAVSVVISPPEAAPAAPVVIEKAVPAEAPVELSESSLAVRRAFRALWAARPRAALAEATTVLKSSPDNVDALAAQALALYDLKRDKSARWSVKRALRLNPQHPLANVLRGFMAQVDHDVPSALAHYDKYLKQHPDGALAAELETVRKTLTP